MENEEIIEEFEVSDEVLEGNEEGMEEAEGNDEVSETSEQSNETGTDGEDIGSVSDNDISNYDARIDDIINELIYQREQMDSLQAYIESKDMTLFEKPLEKYNVTEGLLLLTFFVVVFMALIKLIGGIITCKV